MVIKLPIMSLAVTWSECTDTVWSVPLQLFRFTSEMTVEYIDIHWSTWKQFTPTDIEGDHVRWFLPLCVLWHPGDLSTCKEKAVSVFERDCRGCLLWKPMVYSSRPTSKSAMKRRFSWTVGWNNPLCPEERMDGENGTRHHIRDARFAIKFRTNRKFIEGDS